MGTAAQNHRGLRHYCGPASMSVDSTPRLLGSGERLLVSPRSDKLYIYRTNLGRFTVMVWPRTVVFVVKRPKTATRKVQKFTLRGQDRAMGSIFSSSSAGRTGTSVPSALLPRRRSSRRRKSMLDFGRSSATFLIDVYQSLLVVL